MFFRFLAFLFASSKPSTYVHPVKHGQVTVCGKPGDDVAPKMLASVLKQAHLRRSP
ncbi:MAG: type II toxin-antitoxin system HicA family toxin [Acidobacteriota bacterium]|nr:type II toxin-antitoxin system HicA family toxin [Acidobacteriota bacterium]